MSNLNVNGNNYSDDGTASRDMRNGGHRKWLLPILSDALTDLGAKLAAALTAKAGAETAKAGAEAAASTAINAPGTQATSTTSLVIGTGSKSLVIQSGKSIALGMYVTIAVTASPTSAMYGQVTAYNSGTGALTVNVLGSAGSGTYAAWTVALSGGLPGSFPASLISGFYVEDIADGAGRLQGESAYTLPAGTQDGQLILVERLGLFVFRAAATDPADGETCIAPVSGSGRWLLICPTWDFICAWLNGTDLSVLSDGVADNKTSITANTASITALSARLLSASASLDFPSIAATTGSATLTLTVAGAVVGDRVILAPPSTLPAGLIPAGYVSAADTVSITLFNNTAGAIDPAAMTWGATVLKGA